MRIRGLCSMLRTPREFLVWMRPQPLGNLFYGGSLRTELLIVDFLMVDRKSAAGLIFNQRSQNQQFP